MNPKPSEVTTEIAVLETLAHQAGQQLGDVASKMVRSSTDWIQEGEDYVRQHPQRSVAIAATTGAIAGALLALLFARRR